MSKENNNLKNNQSAATVAKCKRKPATLTTSWSHGSGVAAGLCAVSDGVSELKMFL